MRRSRSSTPLSADGHVQAAALGSDTTASGSAPRRFASSLLVCSNSLASSRVGQRCVRPALARPRRASRQCCGVSAVLGRGEAERDETLDAVRGRCGAIELDPSSWIS